MTRNVCWIGSHDLYLESISTPVVATKTTKCAIYVKVLPQPAHSGPIIAQLRVTVGPQFADGELRELLDSRVSAGINKG